MFCIFIIKKSDWCLWRFYVEVGRVIKGAQRNLKPYIKMFYIHTQRALKIPNVHSRGECGSQRSRSWLIFSIMKLPQEVGQHHDAEKHTQVQAEDEPATAMQPVSQRASPPQRSIPEERSQLLPQETIISHQTTLNTSSTYVPEEIRLQIFVLFLSLSNFLFDNAALPLCLCRIESRGGLWGIKMNS